MKPECSISCPLQKFCGDRIERIYDNLAAHEEWVVDKSEQNRRSEDLNKLSSFYSDISEIAGATCVGPEQIRRFKYFGKTTIKCTSVEVKKVLDNSSSN